MTKVHTFLNYFFTYEYQVLFYPNHHLTKVKKNIYGEQPANEETRVYAEFKRTSKEHKMNAQRLHFLQKVIKVHTYLL